MDAVRLVWLRFAYTGVNGVIVTSTTVVPSQLQQTKIAV